MILDRYQDRIGIRCKRSQIQIFIAFCMCAVLAYWSGNREIMFGIVSVIAVYVIYIGKLSFFSAFSFILWFSFFQQYIAAIDKSIAAGMLRTEKRVPIYYGELYICMCFFLLAEIFMFCTSSVLERERVLYRQNNCMSRRVAYIVLFVSLVLIFLSYPTLPSLQGTLSRNSGYILSARWVPIACFLLASTYDSVSAYKGLVVGWIVACGWVLFHGERVVIFGLLIYVVLKYMNRSNAQSVNLAKMLLTGKRKWILVVATLIIILGTYLQYSRMGISGMLSIRNIFIQGTAGDVVYVFNCSVDMWKSGELLKGYTLLNYLTCWIPGWPSDLLAASVISRHYYTVGGGLFFTEPMMNFGVVGVLPFTLVFLYFINFVLRKPGEYMAIFWIPFVVTIFRMTWYTGLDGWTFMSLFLTPLLHFVIKRIKI